MALVLEKVERVFVEKQKMNSTFQNLFAFGTNWLRRLGLNKLAYWLSEKLYNSISIDKIFGEVYADCHDTMQKYMPDIDQKWGWMQKEHIQFLFNGLAFDEMHDETKALVREYETLLPKKHPVAMATMEAFKADYRNDQTQILLKEVLRRLQLPEVDVDVLFGDDTREMTIHPKFKEVNFTMKMHVPEVKKEEAEELARLAVAGTTVDWVTKMMEQRENLVKATFKPVTGHCNESFAPVSFGVWNNGDAAIDSCTVFFTFPEFVQLKRDNIEKTMFLDVLNPNSSTWVDEDEHQVRFIVGDITLGLGRRSDNVYVRIPHDVKEIEVDWFLSCKTMKKSGKLIIKNEPEYIPDNREVEEIPEEYPGYEDVVTILTD